MATSVDVQAHEPQAAGPDACAWRYVADADLFAYQPLVAGPDACARRSFGGVVPAPGTPGSFTMQAAAGQFALTGSDATFSIALPATVGSFTETGQPVNPGVALPAAAGSFAETGEPANLLVSHVLQAGTGSFALAGQPAGFRISMLTAVGPFALSGQNASLRASHVLQASFGAFALAGQPANFKVAMGAAPGAFAEAGQGVGLGIALPADHGAFALTGEPVAFETGLVMQAATGSFALAGQPASFKHGYVLRTSVGSFSLAGQPASFAKGGTSPARPPFPRSYARRPRAGGGKTVTFIDGGYATLAPSLGTAGDDYPADASVLMVTCTLLLVGTPRTVLGAIAVTIWNEDGAGYALEPFGPGLRVGEDGRLRLPVRGRVSRSGARPATEAFALTVDGLPPNGSVVVGSALYAVRGYV